MADSAHNAHGSTSADQGRNPKVRDAIVALLDKLDGVDDATFRNRRAGARYPFRRFDLTIQCVHPGGNSTSRTIWTRNLSATGMGFLCNSFLHTGTRVQLALERRLGGVDLHKGLVVFCAHVTGSMHQIGMRFDGKVFPKLYLDASIAEQLEQAGKAALTPKAKVDVIPLKGRVLMIDDQKIEHAVVANYLKHTELQLTAVCDERSALRAVKAADFDVVLCDMNMETSIAETTMQALRINGFRGPICIVTAEHATSRLDAVKKAGAAAILHKPFEQSKLIAMIETQLKAPKIVHDVKPLVSTLAHSPQTDALLEKYVTSVHAVADELQQAAESKQTEKVRQLCQSLRGSGTSYGFAKIFETARDALKTLEANNRIEDCITQVQQLAEMCRRVQAR